MKTALIALAIILLAASADARGRGGSGSSSCSYGGGYSGHRSHGGHYSHRGYYGSGDRTPSGYHWQQRGLANIDPRHEAGPATKEMTNSQYYKGRDKHGALVYTNIP